jgi:glycosidase
MHFYEGHNVKLLCNGFIFYCLFFFLFAEGISIYILEILYIWNIDMFWHISCDILEIAEKEVGMKNRWLVGLGMSVFLMACQLTAPEVQQANEEAKKAPSIAYATFSSGYSVVRVTGSVAELSNWSASTAPALSLISNGVWQGIVYLKAGSVSYKLAMNNAWDINRGLGSSSGTSLPQTVSSLAQGGGNITLSVPSNGYYTFTYYEGQEKLTVTVTTSTGPVSKYTVVRVPGSTADLGSWSATAAPALTLVSNYVWRGEITLSAGSVSYKLAMNNAWDINRGLGSSSGTSLPQTVTSLAQGGGNITLSIPANGKYEFIYYENEEKLVVRSLSVVTNTNSIKVHYFRTSWTTVNIHYNNGLGWTAVPGQVMTAEGGSWYVKEIPMYSNVLTFVFNNGSGIWDNNNNMDYRTSDREIWVSNGMITTNNPNGPDTTPPVVTITSPTNNSSAKTPTITIQGTVWDNKGVAGVYVKTNNGNFVLVDANSSNWSVIYDLPEGTNRVYVYAKDTSGLSSTTNSVIFRMVRIPIPVLTASPTSGTTSTTFFFNASNSYDEKDSLSALRFRWDTDGNGTWDTAFSATAAISLTFSTAGTKTVRVQVSNTAGNTAEDSVNVVVGSQPTGVDFREETIYFVITTRFYDGDPNNNYYNRDRIKVGDPQWRGDFKGLIEKLDYIKDLGFTAIWITPPFENRSGLDYHGYHIYDWTKVDPRLESPGATFQDLINAAHAKGLKIVMDVVVNHSSSYGIRGKVWLSRYPIKYFRPQGTPVSSTNWANWPYLYNLGDYKHPYREDNDNPIAPSWFKSYQTSDPYGTNVIYDQSTGAPLNINDGGKFFGTFYPLTGTTVAGTTINDWYHQAGYVQGGDWENPERLWVTSMAGDCIDLNTESEVVRNYINEAIYRYLDMGVDAIRLDTVKHVERNSLLSGFVNRWKARKPSLFVFGENLVKGTGWGNLGGDNAPSRLRPWWYTRLGNDENNPNSGGDSGFSVLDFSLFSTFRDNVSKGSFSGIGGILAMDWVYGDATKLVTFLQNHDVGPDNDFMYRFKGEQWMAAAAYNLLWTIRGIPCLYYGEENEFQKGAPQDIVNATMTIDQTGRAYYGDNLTATKISTTQSHPLYQHIKRLNQIRRAIPALQKAPMQQVNEWGSGISFVRDYNNGESYVVVGLTIGSQQTITVSGVRNGTYRDAVTGNVITVNNGTITFTVKANSAGIYVLNGPGKIGVDGLYLR